MACSCTWLVRVSLFCRLHKNIFCHFVFVSLLETIKSQFNDSLIYFNYFFVLYYFTVLFYEGKTSSCSFVFFVRCMSFYSDDFFREKTTRGQVLCTFLKK